MAHNTVQGDITKELVARIDLLQEDLEQIDAERAMLEERRKQAEMSLQGLRVSLEWERMRLGEAPVTAISDASTKWWVGLGLKAAVMKVATEHPIWEFKQIRDKLVADGFDFKGKKPGNVVNMVLVSLRPKKNSDGKTA